MTAKGDRTRELLIQATTTLVAWDGYHQTTTRAIAKHAGVAEGTLYRDFRDKRSLFFAAVLAGHQPVLDWMADLPAESGPPRWSIPSPTVCRSCGSSAPRSCLWSWRRLPKLPSVPGHRFRTTAPTHRSTVHRCCWPITSPPSSSEGGPVPTWIRSVSRWSCRRHCSASPIKPARLSGTTEPDDVERELLRSAVTLTAEGFAAQPPTRPHLLDATMAIMSAGPDVLHRPTRRAAVIDQVGPVENIRIADLPVPELGPTDVLVAVTAATVNPVDGYVRSGRYDTPLPFPFILGRDLVGTVAAVGSAVRDRLPGDAVWANSLGHQGRQGSYTTLAVVTEDRLYPAPPGVGVETLVAVAHPAITAYLAWFAHASLRPEWTVFVGGGAGNVGTAAIQLARRAGVRVIAGCRPEKADRCLAAGADAVVDDRAPDLATRLRSAARQGVDVFWDTSGGNDFRLAAAAMADGGRILVTAARVTSPEMSWAPLYTHDITVQGFVLSRATVSQLAAGAVLINQMLSSGELTTRIAERYPLEAAAEAHRRIESGPLDGRMLVTVSP